MKKYFLFAVVATIAVLSTGCFATTSGTTSTTKGRTKIETPLSDAKYMSDQNYFRVVELGISPDLSAAMKTARINARTELAATVETAVKAVITSYTQSTATQAESLYEGLATNVVKNKLSGAIEIARETYQTEDGRYEYYVCFELSKQELKDALANEMANDATLKAQFDRERFMDTYDRELANY